MTDNQLAFVIEDDEDLDVIFGESLRAAGFEPDAIQDGLVAIERLKTEAPKVVVLDLHLPHVNGLEILAQIRANPNLVGTKVIMVTADPRMAETTEDADFVLIKPISFTMLRELCARLR
jgi:DNA-binding response OmpR family regulator